MAPLIAVVDDDTDFLTLLTDLLEGEGYRARSLMVAGAAYQDLLALRPDLIILDVRMETPEAGWQLLELLKLTPATAATPVIMCSADAPFLRAKEAHLLERGCAVLEKPFDLDDLLRAVDDALERSPPHSD